MIKLDLATYHPYLQIKKVGKKVFIFDPIRRSEFILQPEEMVRQSWVQYLIKEFDIPLKIISVERQLKLNALKKRFDMVIYKKGIPFILFEFKSFNQPIDNAVSQQIAAYNMTLKVPYLVLSNGIDHFAFKVDFDNKTTQQLVDLSFLSDVQE